MFVGVFGYSVDEHRRIRLPSAFVEQAGDRCQLVSLDGPCVAVYPETTWSTLVAKIREANSSQYAKFKSRVFARSMPVEIDRQGRLLIPNVLFLHARLGGEVILAGMDEHFEIWNPDIYQMQDRPDPAAQLAEFSSAGGVEPNSSGTVAWREGTIKVFISYARADYAVALEIIRILNELGISYFMDTKDIGWGDVFPEKIRQALDEATSVIVIVSPASLQSHWVPYEIGHATGARKEILPYLVTPSLELPQYLAMLQHVGTPGEVRDHFARQRRLIAAQV